MGNGCFKIALLADAAHVNCQRWCEGLGKAGAEIHIISFRAYPLRGIRSYQIPMPALTGKVHYFLAAPYVRYLLKTIRPDVLLAYYVTGYGMLGALTAFHPFVQVTSGSDILVAPRNPAMRLLLKYALGKADLVTAWAPHMASAAQLLGVPTHQIFVLPRGIPFDQFVNSRASHPVSTDLPRVISTRSLNSNYKIDLLLEAAAQLSQEKIPYSVTIAGHGASRGMLESRARDLGVAGQVRFAGFVSNDQLPTLLADHNLYVSLIGSDGVSASLLEAMSSGLLPIVPDHPANRVWIKDGENGILLNDVSPGTIARAISRAHSDLALRHRAWSANPAIVREKADLYQNARAFLETFRQLPGSYRPSGADSSISSTALYKDSTASS